MQLSLIENHFYSDLCWYIVGNVYIMYDLHITIMCLLIRYSHFMCVVLL